MQAYLISDGEFETPRQTELKELVKGYFAGRGFSVLEKTIQRD